MNTSLDCCSKVEVARSPLKVQSHGISFKKNLQTDGTQVRPKEDLPIQLDQANVKVEGFPTVRQSLRVNFNGNLSFQISHFSKLFFAHRFVAQTSCYFLKALLLMTYSKTDMKFPLCPVKIDTIPKKSQHFQTAANNNKEGFLDIIGD